MRLSTRSEYGLRALVSLVRRAEETPVPLRVLAQSEDISEQYLEQIFVELRRAGLVRSVRGARGGYRLARKPEEIPVAEVVRLLEGSLAPVDCLEHAEGEGSCSRQGECVTRKVWEQLQNSIEETLGQMTLADAASSKPHIV